VRRPPVIDAVTAVASDTGTLHERGGLVPYIPSSLVPGSAIPPLAHIAGRRPTYCMQ